MVFQHPDESAGVPYRLDDTGIECGYRHPPLHIAPADTVKSILILSGNGLKSLDQTIKRMHFSHPFQIPT
jgi:hypothetical protein